MNPISAGGNAVGKIGKVEDLIQSATKPFKDGQNITNAGRAVTKHPEYFGFGTNNELRQVYKTDEQLNNLAKKAIEEILNKGVQTTGAGGRYPNGWITYTLPDGRAASWSKSSEFIGFRGGTMTNTLIFEKVGDINSTYPYLCVYKQDEHNPFMEIAITDDKNLEFTFYASEKNSTLTAKEWQHLLETAKLFLPKTLADEEFA